VTETKIVGRIIKVSRGGWGFISSRDIEFTRIFFHWSALKQDTLNFKELEVGMFVEFIPTKMEGRGYRAIQVKVIPKVKYSEPTEGIPEASVQPLSELGRADDGAGNN
jgi:cold shock CspA family protein